LTEFGQKLSDGFIKSTFLETQVGYADDYRLMILLVFGYWTN